MDSNGFLFLVLPAIFLTMGGLFTTIGIFFTNKSKSEKEKVLRSIVVPGTIIDYKERHSTHDGHRSTTYAPVIEYEWNNMTQTHISSVSHGSVKPIGSPINLCVLPDGEVVDADGVKILKLIGIIFTLVGILAIVIGIGIGILMTFINRT